MVWPSNSSPSPSPTAAGSPVRARHAVSGSIRGRISAPIPIVDSTDDDEFPMRQPGTGIAVGPDVADIPEATATDNGPGRSETHLRSQSTPMAAREHQAVSSAFTESDTSSRIASQSRPSTMIQNSPGRLTNPSSMIRHSTISEAPSSQVGSAKGGPERKKSVFRGALGRLFGRKKKNRMSEVVEAATTSAQEKQEKKEAGSSPLKNHETPPDETPNNKSHTRNPSNTSALNFSTVRSRSVGPEGPGNGERIRRSMSADLSLAKMRGGTANMRLNGFARPGDGGPTGLSPRPVSTQAQSKSNADDEEETIGRAITSDYSYLKRRSRSLSGIPVLQDDEAEPRRRSAEIRYWRQSYDPGLLSPLSSGPQEEQSPAQADMSEPTPNLPPKTPPQPFEFGDLTIMNEMAGMKITQAVSLDTRIGSLEARMRRMEKVVTRLAHAVPNARLHQDAGPYGQDRTQGYRPSSSHVVGGDRGYPVPNGGADPLSLFVFSPNGKGAGTTRPSTQQSNISMASAGDTQTLASSVHRYQLSHAVGGTNRPLSTATIRGVASLPTLSKDFSGAMTMDHYTTLIALIDTERAARQALEADVKRLGHQLNLMSRASGYSRTTLGDGPPTGYSAGGTSAFDLDDDDDENDEAIDTNIAAAVPTQNGSAVTSNQYPPRPRDEEAPGNAVDDNDIDDNSHEDAKRKKARTMSLSQLTYKSEPSRHANEDALPLN
jgi:hypothetical protein